MKNQPLFTFVFLISLLALNACGVNTPQAAASPAPASSLPSLLPVEHVAVQVGVGSPIPVDVVVSGTWPSLCAQLAQIHQRVENFRIEITLLTTPPDPNCPPDPLGLPFRIAIPINIVQLPAGSYTVTANGVSAALALPPSPPATEEADRNDPAVFEAELLRILLQRDYNQMAALMGDSFFIALWQSEGMAYPPGAAVEQLQANHLGPNTLIAVHPLPDSLAASLQSAFGPQVNVVRMIYVTGWGLQGENEAVLYLARDAGGRLYWHGVLIAPGGFTSLTPLPAPQQGDVRDTSVEYVMAQADVNIRSGPAGSFAVIGQLFAGQIARVTGVSADGAWWRVICPDDSVGSCWVSADPNLTQPTQPPG